MNATNRIFVFICIYTMFSFVFVCENKCFIYLNVFTVISNFFL